MYKSSLEKHGAQIWIKFFSILPKTLRYLGERRISSLYRKYIENTNRHDIDDAEKMMLWGSKILKNKLEIMYNPSYENFAKDGVDGTRIKPYTRCIYKGISKILGEVSRIIYMP
jgi:hypothetical protein